MGLEAKLTLNEFLDLLLARGHKITKSGGQFSTTCPAHDDSVASLSITEGHGGRILLKCHANFRRPSTAAKSQKEKFEDSVSSPVASPWDCWG